MKIHFFSIEYIVFWHKNIKIVGIFKIERIWLLN